MVASLVVQSVRESFPAYVAHELRTPLAMQRVLLELALADPGTDVATWRETGEELLRACRQQERLLESCLTLARSKAGPRRRDPIDLATIAAEALRAQDPGELERVVELEPAPTTGDPDLTERLVANLISNAIRHNVSGGRIEVVTRAETGRAVLSVTNTGPLIPARELERLFQPFHRLDAGPRCLNDGVGLASQSSAPSQTHTKRSSPHEPAPAAASQSTSPSEPSTERNGQMRIRQPLVLSFVLAVAALALLASGCGGSGNSPGVASVGSSTRATTTPGMAAYSQCMRAHGLPTFPDPEATGGIPKEQVVAASRGNPKTFEKASTACAQLLPNGSFAAPTAQQTRAQLANELSFARCMRRNGVSGFPDPTAQDGLSVGMVQAHGIDMRSPQVLRVVQKCLPASHGGLTAAKVRHAIAEAGR